MELSSLTAISPIDGRYRSQVEGLSSYFSEYGLIQYRLRVETEYFIALSKQKLFKLENSSINKLKKVYEDFTPNTALEIKNLEKITNHDVKSLEYFMKKELDALGLSSLKEFIHFGLTSQDVNNTSIPLLWKESLEQVYFPSLLNLTIQLKQFAKAWDKIPMLARTHGQPASPTRLGKEIMVFVERLENQIKLLEQILFLQVWWCNWKFQCPRNCIS
jgi:adenylosuccinate lyase